MAIQKTIHIPLGYVANITTNAVSSGSYTRLENPGGAKYTPTAIAASANVNIGPFNEPRDYLLDVIAGDIVHVGNTFSGNLTQADDTAIALLAPIASPTFTGMATLAHGTGTEAANAVTINAQSGTITTSALTTAAAGSYLVTLTNSAIAGTSNVIIASIAGGTNTRRGIVLNSVCTAASTATVTIYNIETALALNGTVIINYLIV